MKDLLFITASCLCLLAVNGIAQQYPPAELEEEMFIMGNGLPQDGYTDVASLTPGELLQEQTEALGEQLEADLERATMKGMVRSIWNGQGANVLTFAGISENPDIATVWGISEEQLEQIGERLGPVMEQMADAPEAAGLKLMEAVGITEEAIQDGWEPDLETMVRMQTEMMNIIEDIGETMGSMVNTVIADAFDEFLTPEQLRTIQESQLANIGELPVFSPSIFEALDLTDAQREQMEHIKKELEPDFMDTLDSWVDGYLYTQQRVADEISKEMDGRIQSEIQNLDYSGFREYDGQPLAPNEVVMGHKGKDGESVMYVGDKAELEARMAEHGQTMNEAWIEAGRNRPNPEDIRKRLLAEDPMFREISESMQSKSKTFAAEFKDRMSDVLTDKQRARLQELITNPPEHALAFRKALREMLGLGESEESESVASGEKSEKSSVWMPGPNSWKPGDPVPEQYRIEPNRKSRFTRDVERAKSEETQ